MACPSLCDFTFDPVNVDFTGRIIYHVNVAFKIQAADFEGLAEVRRIVANVGFSMNWRVSSHCRVVNLVRSGRKQPQPFIASAGVRLASLLG